MNRREKALIFARERKAMRKASQLSTKKMILESELSDEEMAELVSIYDEWKPGVDYKVDDLVAYHGALYQVIQEHRSQSDWKPDKTESLYKSHAPAGVIPEWQQPTGGHDAYDKGDKVTYKGDVYKSLIDGNAHSPSANPGGWEKID